MRGSSTLGAMLDTRVGGALVDAVTWMLRLRVVRRPLIGILSRLLLHAGSRAGRHGRGSRRLIWERLLSARAILHTVDRLMDAGALAPQVLRRISRLWGRVAFVPPRRQVILDAHRERRGYDPPFFITISPGHACNLHCQWCYADSESGGSKLPWSTVDRIIADAKERWGAPLIVLSGG